MNSVKSYGNAMSTLESTYLSLCVMYKAYNYIDNKIEEASNNGEVEVFINLSDIPPENNGEILMENREQTKKLANIYYRLGYEINVNNNQLYLSWSNPYIHVND